MDKHEMDQHRPLLYSNFNRTWCVLQLSKKNREKNNGRVLSQIAPSTPYSNAPDGKNSATRPASGAQ